MVACLPEQVADNIIVDGHALERSPASRLARVARAAAAFTCYLRCVSRRCRATMMVR
jgi:predicted O-methyltransferase YrrM